MLRIVDDDTGEVQGYLTGLGFGDHISLAKAVVTSANDARKVFKFLGDNPDVAAAEEALEDLTFVAL